MNYKLSPSNLTFLYENCKHCFVLRVKHGIPRPSIPLLIIAAIIEVYGIKILYGTK
jgi:hypothetical protein